MINRYASLRQGLVGCWIPSLGASGFRLIDRSGNGNHGTLTNMDPGTDWVPSGGKLALDFDGTDDYVIGNQAFVGSAVTFSVWAKFNSNPANYPMLLQLRRSTGANATHCVQMLHRPNGDSFGGGSGSRIMFNVDTTGGNSSFPSVALDANAWFHYLGTYNGTTLSLYKNGIFVQSSAFAGGISTGINELNIANNRASPGDGYFNGNLDDIRIYNRALTPSEIRLLYTGGRGVGLMPERIKHRRKTSAAASNRRRRLICGANC